MPKVEHTFLITGPKIRSTYANFLHFATRPRGEISPLSKPSNFLQSGTKNFASSRVIKRKRRKFDSKFKNASYPKPGSRRFGGFLRSKIARFFASHAPRFQVQTRNQFKSAIVAAYSASFPKRAKIDKKKKFEGPRASKFELGHAASGANDGEKRRFG